MRRAHEAHADARRAGLAGEDDAVAHAVRRERRRRGTKAHESGRRHVIEAHVSPRSRGNEPDAARDPGRRALPLLRAAEVQDPVLSVARAAERERDPSVALVLKVHEVLDAQLHGPPDVRRVRRVQRDVRAERAKRGGIRPARRGGEPPSARAGRGGRVLARQRDDRALEGRRPPSEVEPRANDGVHHERHVVRTRLADHASDVESARPRWRHFFSCHVCVGWTDAR